MAKALTKEEIISAIQECTKQLAHTPSHRELKTRYKIGMNALQREFGGYKNAVAAAGLEPRGSGYEVSMENLFRDWAEIARKAGRIPSRTTYRCMSRYSIRPLVDRFLTWGEVPRGLGKYAEKEGLEVEYADVLKMIRTFLREKKEEAATCPVTLVGTLKSALLPDRPIYGAPMIPAPLACGPTNELGVIYLFGMLAEQLGYMVTRIQAGFPDCEALRMVEEEAWQRVRIEFEYESRNFARHMHKPSECDVIVCWKHNWPECPLEVVELKTVVRGMQHLPRRRGGTEENNISR